MVDTYETAVAEIAQTVFATMLNIDLVRIEDPAPPDQDVLLATVHIAGQWTGVVVLGLSEQLAAQAAAAMLCLPVDEVRDEDRQDVASELVNMIGGNLKSVLPGPSFMSLPVIVSGQAFGMEVRDAALLDHVVQVCEYGLLHTRVYVKVAAAA
jgi:chemotaxis protein CheX